MLIFKRNFIAYFRILVSIILCFTAIESFAEDYAANSGNADTRNISPSQETNVKQNFYYCPSVSELVKSDLVWSAREGRWKSYSQSSSTGVDYFIGAEWTGVNIGKVICLYQGKGSFDFPIALEPTKSVPILEPMLVGWTGSRSGYKLCRSSNVADCPFYTAKKEDTSDIYEQIRYKLKSN